jgi:hypothetical protein
MIETGTFSGVPGVPGLYAMYGGLRARPHVAYVGISSNLNDRLVQHFDKQDSSVVTGVSAAGINIHAVRFVHWWQDDDFNDSDHLHAAEIIAFEVLNPALRSRSSSRLAARELASEPAFKAKMVALLTGTPSGRYDPPRLDEAVQAIRDLQLRVKMLEAALAERDG